MLRRGGKQSGLGFGAYGYGVGDGSGAGFGFGAYGYGVGDGSGSGAYGSGAGAGFGFGAYGYGGRSGAGAGCDDDGFGAPLGADSGDDYWRAAVNSYAALWTTHQRLRLRDLESSGATIAYWCSDAQGRPANGGSAEAEAVSVGTIQTETGPLNLCHSGTLHATLVPTKWKGERRWIVALIGDVIGDAEKLGALKREVLGEAQGPHAWLSSRPKM